VKLVDQCAKWPDIRTVSLWRMCARSRSTQDEKAGGAYSHTPATSALFLLRDVYRRLIDKSRNLQGL
jgi:hypothetical protein